MSSCLINMVPILSIMSFSLLFIWVVFFFHLWVLNRWCFHCFKCCEIMWKGFQENIASLLWARFSVFPFLLSTSYVCPSSPLRLPNSGVFWPPFYHISITFCLHSYYGKVSLPWFRIYISLILFAFRRILALNPIKYNILISNLTIMCTVILLWIRLKFAIDNKYIQYPEYIKRKTKTCTCLNLMPNPTKEFLFIYETTYPVSTSPVSSPWNRDLETWVFFVCDFHERV